MLNALKVHNPTQSPSPGKVDVSYSFQGDIERRFTINEPTWCELEETFRRLPALIRTFGTLAIGNLSLLDGMSAELLDIFLAGGAGTGTLCSGRGSLYLTK